METLSEISPSPSEKEYAREFFIQSEQDGLFFGFEFLQSFLKNSDTDVEKPAITAFVEDGDCVFKGQTCVGINLKEKNIKRKDLISAVSYFSGTYTLVSCFTEKNFDFSISASSTPGFSFSEWEEKAILKAGGLLQRCPGNICLYLEDVMRALKKEEKQIILSNLKMSKKEIKNILKDMPSPIKTCLHGSFFPSDLEEFSEFHLDSVWPVCLQGSFPLLQMKIAEGTKKHYCVF